MLTFRNYFRKLSEFLSFPNNMRYELLSNKQISLLNFIKKKNYLKNKKNNKKLKTHDDFNKKLELLIKNKELSNFLRIDFIQNIFFIHNRLYLVFQLIELILSSNWLFWKKLLPEKSEGNPVPFFLYRKTSGNRIRHVYHLKKFSDTFGLKNFDYIIEIGGGYGCMCDIYKNIDNKIKYIIFDTIQVNLLQYYYLRSLNYKVSINKYNSNIMLISDINFFKKTINSLGDNKRKILISNWGLSEFPINLRREVMLLMPKINFFLISFQEKFEKINNLFFFKNFFLNYNDKYITKFIKIFSMNFLNFNNKHYYLFGTHK